MDTFKLTPEAAIDVARMLLDGLMDFTGVSVKVLAGRHLPKSAYPHLVRDLQAHLDVAQVVLGHPELREPLPNRVIRKYPFNSLGGIYVTPQWLIDRLKEFQSPQTRGIDCEQQTRIPRAGSADADAPA